MSAVSPHIRMLRALAQGFDETAEALMKFNVEDPVAAWMLHVAAAFERAQLLLEAEDRKLKESVSAQ
jgi:hypothetical protein